MIENRCFFDEETFEILYRGKLHGYTIEKFSFNTFWGENDKRLFDIKIVLEFDGKKFLCCCESVEYFSLQKDFDIEFGFDAILISECLVYPDYFEHTLYFVENIPMTIKCQRMYIRDLYKNR